MQDAIRSMLSLSMATAFVVLTGCGGSDKPKAGAPATSSGSPASAASNAASVAASNAWAGAITQPPIPEGQPAEAAAPGRFQIVASGQTRTGPFLLDTQTGRIWQLREFAGLQGSPVAWHEMTIIDDKGGMGITSTQFQKLYPPRGGVPPQAAHRRR